MDPNFAVTALAKTPLFAHASASTLQTVASNLRRRRFRRNEVIFHQGDPGDSLHIVAAGAVKIVLPSAEGEEAIIATLREGDFFGELSLLDGGPRSATVVARGAVVCFALRRAVFAKLLRAEPAIAIAIMTELAGRVRQTEATP